MTLAALLSAPALMARAQSDAQNGRELGQKLRERARESGELEPVPMRGEAVDVGTPAPPPTPPPRERAVTDPRDTQPQPRAVTVAQAEKVLGDLDLQRRFGELQRCRGQVALERRVAVEDVRAGRVLVRWTIGERGAAEDVTVDALAPTEPAVLDCVHARASAWHFDRAPGERLQLSRTLGFAAGSRR